MKNIVYRRQLLFYQHADNPADWYAWNEEALNKAVNEDKPMLPARLSAKIYGEE